MYPKMSSIIRVSAFTLLRSTKFNRNAICVAAVRFSSSSGSDDSSNDKPPKADKTETKTDEAAEKLKSAQAAKERLDLLLSGMSSNSVYKIVKNIETQKPAGYRSMKAKKEATQQIDPRKTQNIDAAADQAAGVLGGNKQLTKNELLDKLKTKSTADLATLLTQNERTTKGKKRQANVTRVEKKEEVVTVSTVQKKIVDEHAQAENSAFLAKLKNKSETSTNLVDFVSKMRVEKMDSVRSQTPRGSANFRSDSQGFRGPYRRNEPRSFSFVQPKNYGSVKLFDGEPLGIFASKIFAAEYQNSLNLWYSLEKHELDLAISQPPANYFEKMILWTEQGKIWHFPIDNEQGLDEEAKYTFEQHVFLDELLDSWCPRDGPVRIFMELVCIGLSKNPYLTVAQKHEHIDWYKAYFEEKKEILQRLIMEQKKEEESSPPLIN